MADCISRRQNKKQQKLASALCQHSFSGSSCGAEDSVSNEKEILKYLIAAQSNDTETLKRYLDQGMPVDLQCLMFQETALHKACRVCSLDSAQLLLSHGANIATLTNDGQSALHIAVRNQHPDMIQLLLDHGAEPDTRAEPDQTTPLMLGASVTCQAALSMLVRAGCGLDLQDKDGMTALHHCFSFYQDRPSFIAGSVACIQLLVEAGADIHVRDLAMRCPLSRAVEKLNTRAVKFLLSQNACPDNLHLRYHSRVFKSPLAFAVVTRRVQLGNLLWYAGASCEGIRSSVEPPLGVMGLADLVQFAFSQPRTLREACRRVVCSRLRICGAVGRRFKPSVEALAIPTSIKEFLLMTDLLA